MTEDVIIVGGGVIGCSIAWRLAQAGLKVTVFERGRIGGEASRAAAGLLSPQGESQTPGPFFDLCLLSRAMYREFAKELTEASGIDVEYKDEGALFITLEGEDEAESTKWAAWQLEAGLPLEHVSTDDLRKSEPAVTQSATRAIFLPEEHQVENRRLMDALDVAMRSAGVEVIEGNSVEAIVVEQGRAVGIISDGVRVAAGVVIVAAGSWSGQLLSPLGVSAQTIPARGQMLAVRGPIAPHHVLHSNRCYIVPRNDRRILIGATVEYAGFQKAVTAGGIRALLDAAIEVLPPLAECEIIETWSGLRPDTSDHLPVLGPSGIEQLILATGHFRNGILLAPVTADLITACILNQRAPVALSPFGIERFAAEPAMSRRQIVNATH